MNLLLRISTLLFVSFAVQAQADLTTHGQRRRFSSHEISVNGFRNPSVGLEYRYRRLSVHAGYYPTIISQNGEGANVTTSFIRTGLTYWFLPIYSNKKEPSSFYVSASYVRGLDRDWKGHNGLLSEAGFRWMVWKGLNIRLGVAVLTGANHETKVNPTPGVGWAFFIP
jgi:hypothetical protein